MAAAAAFNEVNTLLAAALRDLYRAEHGVQRDHVLNHARRRREQENRECHRARIGLSKTSLTMLVAAFLAATNPPATDTRYFAAERTRRARKRRPGASAKRERSASGVPGSGASKRGFLLERLAIFEAMRDIDDVVAANDDETNGAASAALSTSRLVQISTLVRLDYLSREGVGDLLAEPTYRRKISHEQALEFARLVGVELEQFLHSLNLTSNTFLKQVDNGPMNLSPRLRNDHPSGIHISPHLLPHVARHLLHLRHDPSRYRIRLHRLLPRSVKPLSTTCSGNASPPPGAIPSAAAAASASKS